MLAQMAGGSKSAGALSLVLEYCVPRSCCIVPRSIGATTHFASPALNIKYQMTQGCRGTGAALDRLQVRPSGQPDLGTWHQNIGVPGLVNLTAL